MSLRHTPTPTLFPYTTLFRSSLEADYVWWGWSSYDELVIEFDESIPAFGSDQLASERGFDNSWQLRAGGEYRNAWTRSEEHTSELQSRGQIVCRLLLEKKILNALRKLESAGVIESRSLGMKGTFIKVKKEKFLDELDRIK